MFAWSYASLLYWHDITLVLCHWWVVLFWINLYPLVIRVFCLHCTMAKTKNPFIIYIWVNRNNFPSEIETHLPHCGRFSVKIQDTYAGKLNYLYRNWMYSSFCMGLEKSGWLNFNHLLGISNRRYCAAGLDNKIQDTSGCRNGPRRRNAWRSIWYWPRCRDTFKQISSDI